MGEVIEMDAYRRRFKARCGGCDEVWITRAPLHTEAYLQLCPYCGAMNALEVPPDA